MERYISKSERSRELYERAKKVLPAGVSYSIRHCEPYPPYMTHVSGSRVYDVDGNEYTDYWMGHGAKILGHRHPAIVEAIRQQLEQGSHFGFCHEWEIKLAELVVKLVPSAQMVRFTNSGTEGNMYAVRLARAYTKRDKIGKFEGGWHGGYDALHGSVGWPLDQPESAGLTQSALRDTVILPFNDLDGVRRTIRGQELACMLIEPVQGVAGVISAEVEFLKGLRELCDETGTLLIYDEVITGFRLAPGGGQEHFGVIPDLTVLGKALAGGGLPVGGICGRADVMELIDHLKHPDKSERAFHGGTYTANPFTTRAGCIALEEYEKRLIYPHIDSLGERARRGIEDVIDRVGIDAHVMGVGSIVCLHFTKERPRDVRTASVGKDVETTKRYHAHLLSNSLILMMPTSPHFFISTAHTEEDIEKLVSLTDDFISSIEI